MSDLIPTSLYLLNQILEIHSRVLSTDIQLVPPYAAKRNFEPPRRKQAAVRVVYNKTAWTHEHWSKNASKTKRPQAAR